jgi:hypothetical protein
MGGRFNKGGFGLVMNIFIVIIHMNELFVL